MEAWTESDMTQIPGIVWQILQLHLVFLAKVQHVKRKLIDGIGGKSHLAFWLAIGLKKKNPHESVRARLPGHRTRAPLARYFSLIENVPCDSFVISISI